ncbi:MAG: hypothetical protein GY941_22365 [Planctomycetes bacterium]|nr:hypothetical protein [Planctomycetota bacterium]
MINELWDYLTEEQKVTVTETCFEGFIAAIKRRDFDEDVERATDGLVDHILNESTPDLLTDAVKESLEGFIIRSLTKK